MKKAIFAIFLASSLLMTASCATTSQDVQEGEMDHYAALTEADKESLLQQNYDFAFSVSVPIQKQSIARLELYTWNNGVRTIKMSSDLNSAGDTHKKEKEERIFAGLQSSALSQDSNDYHNTATTVEITNAYFSESGTNIGRLTVDDLDFSLNDDSEEGIVSWALPNDAKMATKGETRLAYYGKYEGSVIVAEDALPNLIVGLEWVLVQE